MFQDEARFGRIEQPRVCWAPEGIRPTAPSQIIREYIYAYAAVSPHDGKMVSLILPRVDGQIMSVFLKEVSIRFKDEYILMFMDKAAWHRAKELKVPSNMEIMYIPSYSPDLNPVENIWDEMREKWFANLVFKDIDGVEERLIESLVYLENKPDLVASITGFEWITTSTLFAH